MCINKGVNIFKYVQNHIKDKYLVSLYNDNSRDSSLHYIAFLFYFRGLPGDSLLL